MFSALFLVVLTALTQLSGAACYKFYVTRDLNTFKELEKGKWIGVEVTRVAPQEEDTNEKVAVKFDIHQSLPCSGYFDIDHAIKKSCGGHRWHFFKRIRCGWPLDLILINEQSYAEDHFDPSHPSKFGLGTPEDTNKSNTNRRQKEPYRVHRFVHFNSLTTSTAVEVLTRCKNPVRNVFKFSYDDAFFIFADVFVFFANDAKEILQVNLNTKVEGKFYSIPYKLSKQLKGEDATKVEKDKFYEISGNFPASWLPNNSSKISAAVAGPNEQFYNSYKIQNFHISIPDLMVVEEYKPFRLN